MKKFYEKAGELNEKNIKIISVAALIGLLIIMNYRNQQRFEMQYGDPNKEAWGMTRKEFVYNLQLPSDAWVLEAADKLLNGELVVLDTIEIQPYSLGSMDWNASFSDAYQEHLQALNPIAYLTKAYELTKEKNIWIWGKVFWKNGIIIGWMMQPKKTYWCGTDMYRQCA